ncbi:MAG: hypothetical protein IJB19_08425 [Clostridia bacterium]|nr:hypothetical protein [Clostridia bacterium]
MRKFFPLSFKGKNLKAVILSTLIYTLIVVAVSILVGLFDLPSGVSIAVNILKQIVLLYCIGGIVVSILNACDLLGKNN